MTLTGDDGDSGSRDGAELVIVMNVDGDEIDCNF